MEVRAKVKNIYFEKVKATLYRNKRYFYEYGNKCCRWLACLLRLQRASNYITKIHTVQGDIYHYKGTAHYFYKYYSKLYNLKSMRNEKQKKEKKKKYVNILKK